MRQKIIDECIRLFNEKGCRFTLDDIVAGLHISRKTIYKYFLSKDDILYSMLEETMAGIRAQQRRLALDETLPTREKLRRALTIDTKYEHEIKLEKFYEFEQYMPQVYRRFLESYEEEWSLVDRLLAQGMDEGVYRRMNVPLVRTLLQNGMQMLYRGNFLERSGISYTAAERQMVDIVLSGIELPEGKKC